MVSRLSLIFWRWVVVFHDRLHTARDKAILDAVRRTPWKGGEQSTAYTINSDENVTYTSPSVHYLGSRRRKTD